ncbi:MAG: NADH-quinone oxidoreductase subunit J [Bacteroidetes bacterium]|nr:NADH-quinone oxidoreductase subunit J [Bacteroidota bacterium]
MVIAAKNPVHSVLYLVLTFFGISANYIFILDAPFVGIVNIIVYAGAIMVLFLFVIMLMNLNAEAEHRKSNAFLIVGAFAGGSLLLIVVDAIRKVDWKSVSGQESSGGAIGSIKVLGKVLYTDYILPFEVASVLFLVAIVGAVILARKEKLPLTVGQISHPVSES